MSIVGNMADASALVDERTRALVIDELTANAFVEAGAGTGKTTLLVQRVMALVDAEVPLSSIAAITFTEKAAAELRDRLREQLADRPHLMTALDDAAITTIHGFARSILSAHALRAGLPPDFELVDEIDAQADLAQRFDRFADELFSGTVDPDAVGRAVTLGVSRRNLFAVASALHDQRDRLELLSFPDPAPFRHDVAPVLAAADHAVAAAAGCSDCDDKLLLHLERLAQWRDELARAEDQHEELRLLANVRIPAGRLGRAPAWKGAISKADVIERLDALEGVRQQVVSANVAYVLAVVLRRLADFTAQGAAERQRRGKLEFHDLLVEARRLLATNPAAREAVTLRFAHLLVDEFQDTDPVQLDLVTLIASTDADPGALAWHQRELGAGALFAVGDPKQSIYRFRSADVVLYVQAAEVFGGELPPLRLTRNFRSVEPVLHWINETLAELFQARMGQAPFEPLVAARSGGGDDAVAVLGFEEMEGSAAQVRTAEAQEVANAIGAMIRSGLTIEPKGASPRRLRYNDVAVLLPARTALADLEQAFDAVDVPYRVESRALIHETEEVRTIGNVLRAIDDPIDEVAVLGALRSLAFACSDADLLRWHQAGGTWSALDPLPVAVAADDPVAAAMVWLADAHQRRWWMTLPELVNHVVSHRHLVEVTLAHRRPRDHWRRLEIVADHALAYERAGGRSLRAFVDWLDGQREAGARDAEAHVPDLDDDAVRVMTVHAAKGLEFPVVVLAGLNSEASNMPPNLLWDADGQPLVRIGRKDLGVCSPGFDRLVDLDRALDDAEADRLLYVAATRARDRLLVCLHRAAARNTYRPTAARRLATALASRPDLVHPWADPEPEAPPAPPTEALGQAELELLPDLARWFDKRRALVAARCSAPVVAATSLGGPHHAGNDGAEDERPPWRRGRAGTSIGRAVHAVLQTIDLATGRGLVEVARAQAVAEGVGEHAAEVARLVRAVLDTDVVSQAVGGRFWRELLVTASVDGTVIEGFIDLLVERPDGSMIVVDYKTDAASSIAEIDEAVLRYRRQGAAYALALGAQLGRPVADVVFVFPRATGGAAVARSLPDLVGAIAEVREALSELAPLRPAPAAR
ncbi:MAG: putative ATP-dependent helicase [Acidimicrobiia bacterium]|nr:putative ATP-dependent helicase [Acidimicrobiia bacterium]